MARIGVVVFVPEVLADVSALVGLGARDAPTSMSLPPNSEVPT
jgi:hypothetical protein